MPSLPPSHIILIHILSLTPSFLSPISSGKRQRRVSMNSASYTLSHPLTPSSYPLTPSHTLALPLPPSYTSFTPPFSPIPSGKRQRRVSMNSASYTLSHPLTPSSYPLTHIPSLSHPLIPLFHSPPLSSLQANDSVVSA